MGAVIPVYDRGVAYLEVWLEPETWTTTKTRRKRPHAGDDDDAPPTAWQVIVDHGQARIQRAGEVVASARWNRETHALVDRAAEDEAVMTRAVWQHLQDALRAATAPTTGPLPARAQPEPAARLPEVAATASGSATVRRSGWWALAASVVAIAGALIAWRVARDDVGLYLAIALGVIALGLTSYTLFGAATRCPRCTAWYRRKLESTDLLGTSTENRDESVAVYDSDGKQTGTTYRSVTYEVSRYNYNYRCKQCSHRWTTQGTTSRRIS